MNVLHYQRRRKKPGILTEARLDETSLTESSAVIGYWLLPTNGGYIKLKIPETNRVQSNKGGFFGSKTGAGKVLSVNTMVGSNFLPVWPLINSIDILKKFFPWIEGITQDQKSDIWSQDADARNEAAIKIQRKIISNGFCFVIAGSNVVHWCGQNKELLILFMMELAGMRTFNPASLSILSGKYDPHHPDESEINRLSLLSPRGEEKESVKMEAAFLALFKKKEQEPEKEQELEPLDYSTLGELHRQDDKVEIWNADEGDHKNAVEVLKSRGEKFLVGSYKPNDGEEVFRIRLSSSKLTEASFRELLSDTVRNGGYRVGGLRRVGRIWVYDRTIPGRAENSRFVVTRRPTLSLDNDGFPIYRFQFRSRPDRNTTNMSHAGYIKFIQAGGGFFNKLKTKFKNYFRDEIDLQVHVGCTCPDFKYRWHWVLAKNGCSHETTGIGFDATDSRPSVTNPNELICMCKHLVVAKDYLLLNASEHSKMVANLKKSSPLKPGKLNDPDTRKVDAGTEVADAGTGGEENDSGV